MSQLNPPQARSPLCSHCPTATAPSSSAPPAPSAAPSSPTCRPTPLRPGCGPGPPYPTSGRSGRRGDHRRRRPATQGPGAVALHHPRRRPAAWPHGMPEKRLGQLNYAQMEATFRTNTFGPALVLAHFAPLLPKQGAVCWPCCRPRWAALATTAWAAGTATAPARQRSTCWSKRRPSKWPAPTRRPCWWRCTQAPSTRRCRLRSTGQKLDDQPRMRRGHAAGARRAASGANRQLSRLQRRATAVVSDAAVCYLLIWLARSHQALAADLP